MLFLRVVRIAHHPARAAKGLIVTTPPSSLIVPESVLAAARKADQDWHELHPRVLQAYERADRHLRHWTALGAEDPEVHAAAERLFAWGCAVRDRLPIPHLFDTFNDSSKASCPLEIIRHELVLQPLSSPLDVPGGRLKTALHLDLNRRRGAFLLQTWFDDCALPLPFKEVGLPRNMARVVFADDLVMHMHPAMLMALDKFKSDDAFWDKLTHSLTRLTGDLKGI